MSLQRLLPALALSVFCLALAISSVAAKQSPPPGATSKTTTTQRPSTTPAAPGDYEAQARQIIDDALQRELALRARKRNEFFRLTKGNTYGLINKGPVKLEIENENYRFVHELAGNLSTIPVQKIKDPTLRRIVQLQAKLQLNGLKKRDLQQAKDLLHRMQMFVTQQLVCRLDHSDDCSKIVAMVPDIVNHSMRSRRYESLEYYWDKWRHAVNVRNNALSSFINYVRLLRTTGAYNGHVTPSRTWYLNFETENFQREMEEVVWALMPLYRELHAYLRRSLQVTYGVHHADDDGAIPAPIMEQFLHQAWVDRTAFSVPFPDHHLPQVQTRLKEVQTTASDMAKRTAVYFSSLGLYSLPESFFDNYVRLISGEEVGNDCKAEVYYLPPNVAMRYCNQVDYKKHMQMHGHMAELYFNLYRNETPVFLDHEACPGFSSAIGETAVLASGTPRHLHRLGVLDNSSLTEEQALNRLFRMGVHTLLAVPQYFVNDRYLADIMDGRIGAQDFNCAYWRLMYKYAGIVPPTKRDEKTFDPDFKFYRGLAVDKSNTIKFISEVLGHQLYRAFCLASGQYRPDDPEYPLHNCDYYGSKEVGDMMKQMMRSGATKHWHEVLFAATGDRKLSAQGLLDYFAPLQRWLQARNKELDLEPGWDADIRCSND